MAGMPAAARRRDRSTNWRCAPARYCGPPTITRTGDARRGLGNGNDADEPLALAIEQHGALDERHRSRFVPGAARGAHAHHPQHCARRRVDQSGTLGDLLRLPEGETRDRNGSHITPRGLPRTHAHSRGGGELGRLGRRHFEPRDADSRRQRREIGRIEPHGHAGDERIARDVERRAAFELRAKLGGPRPIGARAADELARDAKPQELLQMLPARDHRLPEDEVRRGFECRDRRDGEEAAGPQAPDEGGEARAHAKPPHRLCNIGHPDRPRRVAEVAGAVAASQEVDLQHRNARRGQRTRLQGGHPPRLVHLLRERMNVDRGSYRGRRAGSRMKDAEPPAARERQHEALVRAHGRIAVRRQAWT
jgi:hypothetical protein